MRPSLLSRARPLALLLIVVLALGIGVPTAQIPHTSTSVISSVLGWAYFSCWSLSFYPQLLLNFERHSVVGLSFDYAALNLVGFGCYAIFNAALFFNLLGVRDEYERAHHGHASAVRANDVVFAVHAFTISAVLLVQIAVYPRGTQCFSVVCKLSLAFFAVSALAGVVLAALHKLTILELLYALSFVKLAITCTKYMPQVLLNARRRSTEGWNMDNVILDFGGGSLSLGHLLLDVASSGDWSAVSGDPVKFGLGFVSMLFDTVFMLQHWVCYRAHGSSEALGPFAPLFNAVEPTPSLQVKVDRHSKPVGGSDV